MNRADELLRHNQRSDAYHAACRNLNIIDKALLSLESHWAKHAPPAVQAQLHELGCTFASISEHVDHVLLEIEGP